ncbi:uncharacterized protein [Rutidosis leptorrhynchoides]|uniref:uncharacterized protein n=1 Tax=Rutidosis leptorrhynchoides TaxID=125765 RepID=UPI003A9902BD
MSFGGRLTLVKSVLNSLPLYYFSLFRAPPCDFIDDIGVPFRSSFVKKIGDGASTSFWNEVWLGSSPLKNRFKRLAHLEDDLAAMADSWAWILGANGLFKTKKLTELIDEKIIQTNVGASETLKNNLVPKKVEIFVWRARKGRLPVLTELDKRGIDLNSVRCPICDNDIEHLDHALLSCKLSKDIMERIFDWWRMGNLPSNYVRELLEGNSGHNLSDMGKIIWQAVIWSTVYLMWKNRNDKVFKNKCWSVPVAVNEIQVKSFEWIARRCKSKKIEWHNWLHNPLLCIE